MLIIMLVVVFAITFVAFIIKIKTFKPVAILMVKIIIVINKNWNFKLDFDIVIVVIITIVAIELNKTHSKIINKLSYFNSIINFSSKFNKVIIMNFTNFTAFTIKIIIM